MPCNGDCNQGRECTCGEANAPQWVVDWKPRCTAKATEPHICPYKDELDDDKTLCTCCADCEYNCADDI